MSRTQTTSLDAPLFELIQSGTMLSLNVNGEHRGALWQIVYPPVHLVPSGRPRYGTWSIVIRVYGTATEVYGFHDNWPFPTNSTRGLWNELAIHAVEDLVTRVEYTGPDGWNYVEETTYDQWIEDDRRPYLPQFSGHADATLSLTCGVTNQGFHTVEARVLGEPLHWAGFTQTINDQHTPPSGQFAQIEADEESCSVTVNSGTDERFNAFVEGIWTLPLRVRVRVPCIDSAGNEVTGKKLIVAFGPFFGDQVTLNSPRLSEWIFERTTPLDEVFNFPAKQHWQRATVQHAFLGSATGTPDPPFPRVQEWGQRQCLSGLNTVAVVVKREEFEKPPLANANDELAQPLTDKRSWLRSQFHPSAEVTNHSLLKLTLPEVTPLPSRVWTTSSGTVSGETLAAITLATFSTNLSPAFECRPYRYLEIDLNSDSATNLQTTLFQGSNSKQWSHPVSEGSQVIRIDLCDPDFVSGTPKESLAKIDPTNVAEATYRGVLTGRFSGIAGLTKIELSFANAELAINSFDLVSDEATLSTFGDGLTGTPNSEGQHTIWLKVDNRDAGRMSFQPGHLYGHFEQLGLRHRLSITDLNETIPTTFRHLYGGWRVNPPALPYRFISNVTDDLERILPQDLLAGAWIRTTLTGRGFLLHPLICEDVMFGGDDHEPFECRFDLVWGWDVSTTAFGGHANVQIAKPNAWSYIYPASAFGEKRGLPVTDGTQTAQASWFANPSWQRSLYVNPLRQSFWIGVEGSQASVPSSVHSARDRHGQLATVESSASTSLLYRNQQSNPIPVTDVQDLVVSIGPSGWQEIAYVYENTIWSRKTQSWGESWEDPIAVASGEEIAIATCPRTGITVLAIHQSGIWNCYRRDSSDNTFEVQGAITESDPCRAGLEFNSSAANELIFALPSEGTIRTFRSLDWGSSWQEVR